MTPGHAGETYAGRSVLVTGGLGFIGSSLVRTLTAEGARVRILDSLLPHGGGSPRNVADIEARFEVVVEDTRNRDIVQRAVEGVDVIFHLAAPSGPGALPGDWYTQIDIACLGTLHLLEAVRTRAPRARFVFASSHHVYQPGASGPVPEDAPTEPSTLFGVHKLAGEKYCGVFQQMHRVDSVVARMTSVFGPRQYIHGAPVGSLAHILDAALHGEDVLLIGAGENLHDVLYVEDAVDALLSIGGCAAASGSVLNVGAGVGVSLRELAALVVEAVGRGTVREVPLPRTATHGGDSVDFVADVSRLRRIHTRFQPSELRASIRKTVEWFTGRDRAV